MTLTNRRGRQLSAILKKLRLEDFYAFAKHTMSSSIAFSDSGAQSEMSQQTHGKQKKKGKKREHFDWFAQRNGINSLNDPHGI